MNILVTIPQGEVRNTFLTPDVQERLCSLGNVRYNALGRQYTRAELKEALDGIDVVISGWGSPALTDEVLEGNDTVKMLAHTGGSVADFVNASTYEKGIRVVSGNKLYAESVAEATVAYILCALRYIPNQMRVMAEGGWKPPEYAYDRGILGRQIGILGVGTIARYLMQMLRPFRCSFLVWDDNYTVDPEYLKSVNARQTSLEEVMRTCSVVSLHASLTEKSRGLIGKKELSMMPKDGVFVNTARGAIMRQAELYDLLTERPDLRVVLDVYEKEPLEADSPLRTLPNTYLMPHRGGPTVDYRSAVGMTMADEIERMMKGEALQHEILLDAALRMTTHK